MKANQNTEETFIEYNGIEFEPPVFETEIRVRYAETDRMDVVYYGNYFTWFEVARGDVLRQIGYPYSQIEKDGVILPVGEAYCKYIAPTAYDDLIVIASKIDEFSVHKISFIYEIYKMPERKLCSKGYTMHPIIGRDGKILRHDNSGVIDKIKKSLFEFSQKSAINHSQT
ncbi:MAG: thioesterase family protein [Candidatus Wallbacteria bacterium]